MKIPAILDRLEAGKLTLDQAVAEMTAQPARPSAGPPESALDLLSADRDPELPEPGSFYAVSRAYAEGRIDAQQYKALSQAAAAAARHGDPSWQPAKPAPASPRAR